MSDCSSEHLADSMTLSADPALPLWNFVGLFVSGITFAFWDCCGIGVCILKDIPTGVVSKAAVFAPESSSKIALHKQWSKSAGHYPRSKLTGKVLQSPKLPQKMCRQGKTHSFFVEKGNYYRNRDASEITKQLCNAGDGALYSKKGVQNHLRLKKRSLFVIWQIKTVSFTWHMTSGEVELP